MNKIFIVTISFCLLFVSCNQLQISDEKATFNRVNAEESSNQDESISNKKNNGLVKENYKDTIKWVTAPITTDSDLFHINFINKDVGWLASHDGFLLRTTDGGNSFHSVPIKADIGFELGNVTFLDSKSGWAVLNYNNETADSQKIILHTKDGGENWTKQYTAFNAEISKLEFLDNLVGWVVGTKKLDKIPITYKYFIAHTSDGGKNWIDYSEILSKTLSDNNDNIENIQDIFVSNTETIIILNDENNLYKTSDGGRTWEKTGKISRPESMIPNFIKVSKKKFEVLLRKGGNHGYLSKLLSPMNKDVWLEKTIPNIYLSDVVYLSKDRLIAAGSMLTKGDSNSELNIPTAVILYSTNNWENWQVIYKNQKVARINALSFADKERIWAVGNNGFVISAKVSEIMNLE